jgi:hypothetical protein
MPQFVVEFGAEQIRFVVAAIRSTIAEPFRIKIDSANAEMCYSDTAKTLDEVSIDLQAGSVVSTIIRTGDARIRYALITSPKVHVPPLGLWMGTIEVQVEDWSFVWDTLVRQSGLRFICVGLEEGVELGDDQISVETFPWRENGILAAVVRDDAEGEWTQRVGSQIDSSSA